MIESDRQLQEMASRVAKQVESEKAKAKPADKKDAITPDFVARCATFSEKGDGLLHSALFRGKLTYVPESKGWYCWEDHHWRSTHIHMIEASVEQVGNKYREVAAHYEQLAKDASEGGDNERAAHLRAKAEALHKRASWLNSSRGVNACVKFTLANSDPLISKPDVWDTDPWLLGVANGVVDLRTGEHRPGRPEDYILRYCPVEWKGLHEPAPLWEETLQQIIGASEGVLPWLHKVLGYAITGQSTEPLFLMLYGERGRNGKTVVMETLKKVLGPYMGPVPAELLLDRKIPKDPDSASPTIMNMKGMRIIWPGWPPAASMPQRPVGTGWVSIRGNGGRIALSGPGRPGGCRMCSRMTASPSASGCRAGSSSLKWSMMRSDVCASGAWILTGPNSIRTTNIMWSRAPKCSRCGWRAPPPCGMGREPSW